MSCSLTIFTPTFNRAYILDNLYESLKRQTSKDFEWIIVDDSSTDCTEEMVKQWISKEKAFSISYRRVKHGGKHRAFNKAVQLAKTDAFFTVDSDDYLIDDAVKKIIKWFDDIKGDKSFAGVSGLRGSTESIPIGGASNIDGIGYVDATNLERVKYNLQGDKAEVYKTEILREYPFKEFVGEDFITEATVWDVIALNGYKLRWHNEIIYITKYLDDGLTYKGSELFYKNPRGWYYWLSVRSHYTLEKKIIWEYVHWYLFNFGESLINDMEESYKIKVNEVIDNIVSSLNSYIEKNEINSYAIYGLGDYGEIFWKIKNRVNASLLAGIDINKKGWKNIPVYSPNQIDSIKVDLILITMKNKNTTVLENLDKFRGSKMFFVDLLLQIGIISNEI